MENNEIRTPRRLFEEMIERKKNVAEAEKIITEEKIKYKERVCLADEEAKTNRKEIMKIRETQIKIGADTLVEELAKEWGVAIEDLLVDVKFVDTERFGKIGRNKFIKLCENESFDGLIKCYLNISCDNANINNFISFKLPLNLLHYQRNGERLKRFLDVKSTFKGWCTYTDFECPDYKNLIFEIRYDNLVDVNQEKFTPRNKNCELILNAYERECEKNAKNDMLSHDIQS